jgi:hypothetical protein
MVFELEGAPNRHYLALRCPCRRRCRFAMHTVELCGGFRHYNHQLANVDDDGAHARTAGIFPVCFANLIKPENSLDRHGDLARGEPTEEQLQVRSEVFRLAVKPKNVVRFPDQNRRFLANSLTITGKAERWGVFVKTGRFMPYATRIPPSLRIE